MSLELIAVVTLVALAGTLVLLWREIRRLEVLAARPDWRAVRRAVEAEREERCAEIERAVIAARAGLNDIATRVRFGPRLYIRDAQGRVLESSATDFDGAPADVGSVLLYRLPGRRSRDTLPPSQPLPWNERTPASARVP
jgi:hypothetical protein